MIEEMGRMTIVEEMENVRERTTDEMVVAKPKKMTE